MPSTDSRYLGRRCDAVDRDGNRCELPFGHGQARGTASPHLTSVDDQPRVWATRLNPSLRNYR